jgi:hypothetical protein
MRGAYRIGGRIELIRCTLTPLPDGPLEGRVYLHLQVPRK